MPKPKIIENNDKSDSFSPTEQKAIVTRILADIRADEKVQEAYIERRKLSLAQKNCEPPSELEGIEIKNWQSDRNLGVAPAVADTYQATLLAATWNPESIHATATEKNDIDNKDNVERFAKWMISKNECDMGPEADDYIQNKVDQGFSIFEIYRKVWFEWIERKIVKRDGSIEYKTEKKRFEKGVIENVANLDDILMPRFGTHIQKLPHIMRIVHLYGDDMLDFGEAGQFENVTAKLVMTMKHLQDKTNTIEADKAEDLELEDVVDEDFRAMPIDVYKWYGTYTKNGRRERYRFLIEPKTETFLSGKPLRKITKTGKYPFVGGPFEKVVGQIRGKDIYEIIEDPCNAFNLTFNQKADFQYVTNCPFGFHKDEEGYTSSQYKLEPGVSYPTAGNPNESVYFPNIQRSMAWAQQDFQILYEVIEKRTGAATYFASNDRNSSGTATRDRIVEQKSATRYGKWVIRILAEFSEAVTMLLNIYQESMPKNLGERVLGEDGKMLFKNLSVETIRYNADVQIAEDVIAGSKSFERQVSLWAFEALQNSVWLDPRVNPKGNWLLTRDTMKKQGLAAPERYLPPEPKPEMGTSRDVENIWARLMQGEIVEPDESWNVPEVLAGLMKKAQENYFDLDPEYRPNLEELIFKTQVAYRLFIKRVAEEQMASQIAQRAIEAGQRSPQGANAQPAQPQLQIQAVNQPMPGQNMGAM
jgi:hypothetical protein